MEERVLDLEMAVKKVKEEAERVYSEMSKYDGKIPIPLRSAVLLAVWPGSSQEQWYENLWIFSAVGKRHVSKVKEGQETSKLGERLEALLIDAEVIVEELERLFRGEKEENGRTPYESRRGLLVMDFKRLFLGIFEKIKGVFVRSFPVYNFGESVQGGEGCPSPKKTQP